MESHFSILGIARGTSESEMKKAYKAKALQYHPDRNPQGLEVFKKVNAAYEALTQHYKKGGGVDKRGFGDDGASSILRTNSGRHWGGGGGGSRAPPSSTPLFTEEELFGRMPNDFGVFGGGTGGSSTRNAYQQSGRGYRQSRQQAPPPPSANTTNEAADDAWRNAHGARQPQSGYNAFGTDTESSAFQSQMRYFEEMEKMKRSMGMGSSTSGVGGGQTSSSSTTTYPNVSSSHRRDSDPPRFGRRSPAKGDKPLDEDSSSSSRPLPRQGSASSLFRAKKDASGANSRQTSAPSVESDDTGTAPSYSASQHNINSQRELEAEWAHERDRQARMKRAQEEMEATDRRLRREQREAETREEWERTQAEMELERTNRVAEERIRELQDENDGMENCVDDAIRQTALDRRKERSEVLQRLLPSRPLLDKMSIQELYILRELVNEFQSNLFSMTESRIRSQTMCLVCHASKKDERTTAKFKCSHGCICFTCSFTCALCPICGADRTDM